MKAALLIPLLLCASPLAAHAQTAEMQGRFANILGRAEKRILVLEEQVKDLEARLAALEAKKSEPAPPRDPKTIVTNTYGIPDFELAKIRTQAARDFPEDTRIQNYHIERRVQEYKKDQP